MSTTGPPSWSPRSIMHNALRNWKVTAAVAGACAVALAALVLALVASGGPRATCNPRLCVEVLGPRGSDVDPLTPVRIRIRGQIDRDAAIQALSISNAPPGKTRFEDDVLTFRPDWPGFARGVEYQVHLGLPREALPARERRVDLRFEFTTGGLLKVANVFPAGGSQEIALDAGLIIQFNRSVAPLTVLAKGGPRPVIEFEPEVAGQGRWLNSSLFAFNPTSGWAPATTYTARVKAGLTNDLGSQLPDDYVFTFSTISPAVASVYPPENSKFVPPEQEVRVEFNQPVDRASAEAAFRLQTSNRAAPLPGSYHWTADNAFAFHPSSPLAPATTYIANLNAGVKASGSNAGTAQATTWTFSTVGPPRVTSTSPPNGAQSAPQSGVRLSFSNPMDRQSVEDSIRIEPAPASPPFFYWDQGNLNLNGSFYMRPSTSYRVTLNQDAKDRYGQPLVDPLDLRFTTAPLEPGISIWRRSDYRAGTFDVNLDPTIYASSWNVSSLSYRLYHIDAAGLMAFESDPRNYQAPQGSLIREWSQTVDSAPNQTVVSSSRLAEDGARLDEGFYFLSIAAPGIRAGDSLAFVVTSAVVTTKGGERDLLVWALDQASGQALAGMPVEVIEGDKVIAQGTTGRDGVASIGLPKRDPYRQPRYYVSGKAPGRTVFASVYWQDFSFGPDIPFQLTLPPLVGNMYTDRPIYRPGETVHIKGTVRADDDATYSVPQGLDLDLQVRDDQGRELDRRPVTLSDFGTFDSDLGLSPEASTGLYSVSLQGPGTSRGPYDSITYVAFRVAEFRKPEFEVDVSTPAESYVSGQRIEASLSADLFFGSPLPRAKVNWRVTAQPYFFRSDDYPGFAFSDYSTRFDYGYAPFSNPQFLRGQGEGLTGADGRFSFGIGTDLSADPLSQRFVLEGTVTDENAQQVAGFTSVIVHKGAFYVGLKPESYVAVAGRDTRVSVVTIDPESRTVASVPVRINIYERRWRTVRQREADGELRYKSEPDDSLFQSLSVTTDASGKASFAFAAPNSGQYLVVAEATDAAGNTIKSGTFLWVSSTSYASWRVRNDDTIALVADKEEYRPGETARVLVAAPFQGSTGLVTQERGRVLSYATGSFQTNSQVLEVPIASAHIPNFYLGVALFMPPTEDNPLPQVKFGMIKIKVATTEKKLDIAIEPDQKTYGPRDTVTYRIRTTDSSGRGVPAEVSLALVDKAVLSLQDDLARPAFEAFWSERPLGILTASSFVASVDRANEQARGKGGGGGGGPGDQTRSFFPNTAFWQPALRTGADGRATVQVKLPDTLTTWRLTARGVTRDSKAGEARNEIVTTQDVIVRPVVPRFFVAGDQAQPGVIVHNFTPTLRIFEVSLKAEGVEMGEAVQSIEVASGGSAVVRWPVTVAPGSKSAVLTFRAESGGHLDEVGLTLPVYAYFTPETVATAGQVTDLASEAIEVPDYVLPDAGGLTVTVSPSVTSGVNTAFYYLQEYPWESAEVTVSRFIAALSLRRAVVDLNLTDVSSLPEAPDLARRSLQRLYGRQGRDGGWGWWGGEVSDPAVTAYVLVGFAEAKNAGLTVDGGVESRATQYLVAELDKRRDLVSPELDLRAFILYALARDQRGQLSRSLALAEQRSSLSNIAKAWVALSLKLAGGVDTDPRLTALMSDLQASAVVSATATHWEEARYNPNVFGNSTQTTAQVLQAFTLLQPENPLVDSTVRWLMIARKEGRWECTQATALALLSITDFMRARRDVQEAFDYQVSLNGRVLLDEKAAAGKIHQEDSVVIAMKDLLRDGVNDLRLARLGAGGPGRLYYTADLRYFTPAQEIESLDRGIAVSHQYFMSSAEGDTPVNEVSLGDVVKVKVTVLAPAELHFLVVEDFLPAGLEPVDTSLKITPMEFRERLFEAQRKNASLSRRFSPFGHTDVRDNRVALFARFAVRGAYEYTYFARATTPGIFQVPPAVAYEQYFPDVFGRSDGGSFVVKPGTDR